MKYKVHTNSFRIIRNSTSKRIYFLTLLLFFVGGGISKAQITTILNFNGTNGQDPYGSVILSGHVLYGMTESGGKNNWGCVFSVHTDGSGYKDLWDFDDTGSHAGNSNGELPYGSLLLLGNKLYGMTSYQGANGYGLIFSVDSGGGGYKDLFDFDETNGATPWGSLISSGTQLFGMTRDGGPDNYGVVFSIDTNGSDFKDLIGFTGVQGINPYGSLTLVGHKLYGMTIAGGAYVFGNIFSIDTNGSGFTDLYDFGSVAGTGRDPYGAVTLVGKKLYGMTYEGGANNDGLIFSFDTVTYTYTDLLDFNNASSPEGRYTEGSLTSSGSLLYGMTTDGGADGYGVIFSIDTNGSSYNDLVDFNGTNGALPYGDVIVSGSMLYGMTENSGAPYYHGLVFGFNPVLSVSIEDTNVSCHGGHDGIATAIAVEGTTPYTYLWNDANSQTTAIATGLVAGTYTVYVHDANNNKDTAFVTITQPSSLGASVNTTADVSCHGDNTGSASSSVSGGTIPYTYSWTGGGGTNATATGLAAGTYTLTVRDACGGDISTASVIITQPSSLAALANTTADVSCYGYNTGSASSSVSGGTIPYTYSWTGSGGSNSTATGLAEGTYTLTVRDVCGASSTSSVIITQPTALVIITDSTVDNGTSNGSVSVNVSGGIAPYTYSWNPGGETTNSISGLSAGSYCCTISDVNGCAQTTCITVISDAGINNISNSSDVNIYPNPTIGNFIITGVTQGQVLELYNILGQELNNVIANKATMYFNISSQADGIYLLRILNKDGSLVIQKKIIKGQ